MGSGHPITAECLQARLCQPFGIPQLGQPRLTGASGCFGFPPEPSHHMRMGRPALSRSIAQFMR